MRKALLYTQCENERVRCNLCAHGCLLSPGSAGLCGVRRNAGGHLFTLVGDNIVSANIDPVEKKPLYHYRPGTNTFSFGTMGCNFACSFCQNADISRYPAEHGEVRGQQVTPEALVNAAQDNGCPSLAFTYNEPTVFFELMLDTARAAQDAGIDSLMVSNGFQSRECLKALGPYIRAANIDLKAFTETFYRERCQARLAPVLENLRIMRQMGWWLEITTLFIPGLNDTPEEMTAIVNFIRDELGADTPWHVSAFHPCYRLTHIPRTPDITLRQACEIALAQGLTFVYPGNTAFSLPTRCFACGHTFVERDGWHTFKIAPGTHCPRCNAHIAGLWE